METLLKAEGELEYLVGDAFDGTLLVPVAQNLLWKARHGWDDYDEVCRCSALVRAVAARPGMTMDFHRIRRAGETAGVVLLTHGALDLPLFFPDPGLVRDPVEEVLSLNSFHIGPEQRGCGERWLTGVIFPYYRERGYRAIYLKSSHPRAFSLYRRHGEEIGAYRTKSDNGLFEREGRVFRLPLA